MTSADSGGLDVPADGTYIDPELERERSFEDALHSATPPFFLTTLLVAANVALFVAMLGRGVPLFNPSTDQLIGWGANYGPATQSGQWWRLLTAAFVHVGVVHLAMNMIVLWTGGRLIERLFGQVSFATLYLVSALGGSIASIAVHPMTTSAGASGAVFGIYGGLIAYLLVCHASLPHGIRSMMIRSALTFVAYNLIYGLALPHVDVAAHVGGLLAGFVAGAAMATPMGAPRALRVRRAAVATAVLVPLLLAGAARLPRFDDWTGAVAAWLKEEERLDRRIAEEGAKVDARKIPPQAFAERIDQEFVPELGRQRARMAALRLPESERAKAAGVVAFLGLKIDALELMAEAERTGNADTLERANKKNEEALAAMLAVAPSPALTARIQQMTQQRQLRHDFAAEIKRLQEFERGANLAYQDAVKRLRANRLPPAEFASLVENTVVNPWLAERDRLEKLPIPAGQKEARQRLLDYMSLRGESWKMIAEAVRNNDQKLMRAAAEKAAAANTLLQQR